MDEKCVQVGKNRYVEKKKGQRMTCTFVDPPFCPTSTCPIMCPFDTL